MAPVSLRLVKNEPWSECLVCKKPLGADSKDQGYMFCHEHRKCSTCELDISAEEARWCLRKFEEEHQPIDDENYVGIEIIHAKCLELARIKEETKKKIGALTSDPTHTIRQSELDFLNLIRLMVIPDKGLSQLINQKNAQYAATKLLQEMDFEEKSLFQKKMEAYIELTQDTVRRDPSFRKEFLAEREKERFDKAQQEKQTSSRPISKSAEAPEEIQLAAFVELNGLDPKNREANLKAMKRYWKAVKSLQFNKKGEQVMTEQQAMDMCKGFLKFTDLKRKDNGVESKEDDK